MAYTFRLRSRSGFDVTVENTLTIVEDNSWAVVPAFVGIKIYTPSGTLLPEQTVAPGGSVTVDLPEDVDGNAVEGVYTVIYEAGNEEVVQHPELSYTPRNAAINAYADGYRSRFYAYDATDYGSVSSNSRSFRVTPPAGMVEKTVSTASITYVPNIYSGEYTVDLAISYTVVSGITTVMDASVVSAVVNVYAVNIMEVMGWVDAFLDQYVVDLSTNPREAKANESKAIRLSLLLHKYQNAVRGGEYLVAYMTLDTMRGLLSADAELTNGEIIPFQDAVNPDLSGLDMAALSGLEVISGDLYWNGTLLAGVTVDGKVKMDAGDTLGYLGEKLDEDTLSTSAGKMVVTDKYITDRLGEGLTWNAGTGKVDASATGSGGGLPLTWSGSVTYGANDVVSVFDGRIKLYRSLIISNTNKNPLTSADWEEIYISASAHAQNTDYRLGNVVQSVNLGDAVNGVLTCDWKTKNVIRITRNDDVDTLVGLSPTSTKVVTDADAETHDLTLLLVGTAGSITIAEGGAGVGFNNKGRSLVFTGTNDWVRYRYNPLTGKLDLMATSIKTYADTVATDVDTHLRDGDDSVYSRFMTGFRELGGVRSRMAIPVEAETSLNDLNKETGVYYSDGWYDYPAAVHGTPEEPVSGWVAVYTTISDGAIVVVQVWLAVGGIHPNVAKVFDAKTYQRAFDGTSWTGWTSASVTLDHDGLSSWTGDTDSVEGGFGKWHLTVTQKEAATRNATASQSGLLRKEDFIIFSNKQSALTFNASDFTVEAGNVSLKGGSLSDMFELVEPEVGAPYIVAKHDLLGEGGITAYATGGTPSEAPEASQSFEIAVSSGATLADKAVGTLPSGWSVTKENGTDLVFQHDRGQIPSVVNVYANVGASIWELIEFTTAYSSLRSESSNNKFRLAGYVPSDVETRIKIVF